jgi:hypothetical protein
MQASIEALRNFLTSKQQGEGYGDVHFKYF